MGGLKCALGRGQPLGTWVDGDDRARVGVGGQDKADARAHDGDVDDLVSAVAFMLGAIMLSRCRHCVRMSTLMRAHVSMGVAMAERRGQRMALPLVAVVLAGRGDNDVLTVAGASEQRYLGHGDGE